MLICWYIVFLLGVDIFHVDFHVEIGQSNMFTVCLLAPAIGSRRISGSRTIARREVAAKLQRTTHRGTWHAATRWQHAGVESRMRDLAMWLHIIHVMLYTYVYLFFYVIYVFVFLCTHMFKHTVCTCVYIWLYKQIIQLEPKKCRQQPRIAQICRIHGETVGYFSERNIWPFKGRSLRCGRKDLGGLRRMRLAKTDRMLHGNHEGTETWTYTI